MAVLETHIFKAHNNIYIEQPEENYRTREIRTEMVFPDCVNENTGMLVLIPGYGGNIDSHVFRKMREVFAEQYNLITVQCDYFGNKFMDAKQPEEMKLIATMENIVDAEIYYKVEDFETVEEFNDMGIMQAIDIVSSTICAIYEIIRKGYIFNTNKIILFGTSHGAYLAHLANIICPTLYTVLIDVSSYIKPYYLDCVRDVTAKTQKMQWISLYMYFITKNKRYQYNENLYDLSFLYQSIENRCKIIALQGTEDTMVSAEEKEAWISNLENAQLLMIHPDEVDGVLCKNADHGLGLDFFELFKTLMPSLDNIIGQTKLEINFPKELTIGNGNICIKIGYENGLPEIRTITW